MNHETETIKNELLGQKFFFNQENYKMLEKDSICAFFSANKFKWFKTNKTGIDILEKLQGTKTLNEIINEIAEEYELPYEICKKDIIEFCQDLIKRKIIFKDAMESKECEKPYDKIQRLYIDITNECYFTCKYCNKLVTCKKDEIKELSPGSMEKIMQKLSPWLTKSSRVCLTGGEPLLHKDLEQLLNIIIKYTKNIAIWTSGENIEQNINIIKKYCNLVFLSMDTFNQELNNEIRGKGAFETAVNAAKVCDENSIKFLHTITLNKYNVNENLEEFIPFSAKLGSLGVILNQEILIKQNNKKLKEHFNYEKNNYIQFLQAASKKILLVSSWDTKKHRGLGNNFLFLRGIDICRNSLAKIQPKINCSLGINELHISVDEEVFPCHALHIEKLKIDHINNYTLDTEKIIKTREIDKCNECYLNIICLSGCRTSGYYNNEDLYSFFNNCNFEKESLEYSVFRTMSRPLKRKVKKINT